MPALGKMEFEREAVTITWCACERCRSVGPRSITLIKHQREYEIELTSDCCGLVSGRRYLNQCD
jgi:hypothetical protein